MPASESGGAERVASAWLRAGNSDRANAAFASATHIAQSVSASPIGQVTVLSSIAEAQLQGGLAATSQETLKAADVIADLLPVRPEISAGKTWPQRPLHDRLEAYREIFRVAIRAHDLGKARQVAALSRQTGPNNDDGIVQAWYQANETDEAIAFARSIPKKSERAATELWLAQIMLDQAGAPNI